MKQTLLAIALVCAAFGAAAQSPLTGAADNGRAMPKANEFGRISVLAANGNRDAMLQLGKMYWRGVGVDVDRDKAATLFRQAAAAGHPDAAQTVKLTERREQQRDAIRYWTTEVSAVRLAGVPFSCTAPAVPQFALSRTQALVVRKAYDQYRSCYNGYVDMLYGDTRAEGRIPAELVVLMSEDEIDQAGSLIDSVVASAIKDIKQQSGPLLAELDRWAARSEAEILNDRMRWVSARIEVESRERMQRGF